MALAKHHEEIAEKILANLENREFELDWASYVDSIDRKHGGRLAKVAPEYRALRPPRRSTKKPNTTGRGDPREILTKVLAILLAKNEKLDEELKLTRIEFSRIVEDRIIPGKIGKRSPIVRELIGQIHDLENQVRILKSK